MWKKIKRCYPPIIDAATFLILLLTIIYLFMYFGQLPDEIPTHFNLAGEADGWGGKGMLIGLLVIYIHTILLLFVLNYFLIIRTDSPQDGLQFINIPTVKFDELTDRQVERVRGLTARMMAVLNLMTSIMFALIHIGIIRSALGRQEGLGWGAAFIILAIFVLLAYYTWKIIREAKRRDA